MLFEKIQLEPGEEVLKVVRKHWFIIAVELFGTFLMLLLPFFILFIVALFPNSLMMFDITLGDYTKLITYAVAGWSILTIMTGFATWTHYYLDLWIITDRRIILVDQIHFFNRNVSIFRLERMQDIEFKISGIIPTLLNFGTLKAQTAGAQESNFTSNGLPDPRGLQATIQKAMDNRLRVLHIDPQRVE
tara:strand:- start:3910 stop:4476 length:567 start_codon:yes stop_codon:yes gene_type:complete